MISKLAVGFTLLSVAISTMFLGAQATNSQTRIASLISQDSRNYTTITKVSVSAGVKINQTHLFQGEINRKGLAVGYHHRSNGKDFVNAKLVKITGLPNSQGIYAGRVEIRNPITGKWVSKLSSSTFFPDRWSQVRVLTEIRGAFATVNPPTEFWQGTSPSGIRIEGYYSKVTNSINTAYPVYRR